jgi:hypothetical protein
MYDLKNVRNIYSYKFSCNVDSSNRPRRAEAIIISLTTHTYVSPEPIRLPSHLGTTIVKIGRNEFLSQVYLIHTCMMIWRYMQGDQIGLFFAHWVFVILGKFFDNCRSRLTFCDTLFHWKVMYKLWNKWLGYILADFLQTHLVSLVIC